MFLFVFQIFKKIFSIFLAKYVNSALFIDFAFSLLRALEQGKGRIATYNIW